MHYTHGSYVVYFPILLISSLDSAADIVSFFSLQSMSKVTPTFSSGLSGLYRG